MIREDMISRVRDREEPWDIVIIGGGATGLGVAIDSASRGYSTLLLEQHDFAKGTSSRSTKLVHGGVRYLQQGDISLVFEALRERGLLRKNAPHLVKNLKFVIPSYDWWNSPFYTVGLKVYDMMAGSLGLGPSTYLSMEETIDAIPTVEKKGLRGGVIYHDGQFDDARMAVSMAMTSSDYGATLINYCPVREIIKENGLVSGVVAEDLETGDIHTIKAKVVVNASGVFADKVIRMDDVEAKDMIKPSQGIHLVLDKEFLPGDHAIMVPQTSDGRVMFAVPWYDKVVLGTTDTVIDKALLEPVAMEDEINFILNTAARYLTKSPSVYNIKSIFAGLRPLAAPEGDEVPTKEISRHHKVMISVSGMITIVGGKWTTYRKMAEDTVDHAIMVGNLKEKKCVTEHLHIHGYSSAAWEGPHHVYGSDQVKVRKIEKHDPQLAEKISDNLQFTKSMVVWAVRHEMARTVEDVLARRTRALFLDAKASIEAAPLVARLMAKELGKKKKWEKKQVQEFNDIARNYYWQN
jgi:glycerol-3-phosphate dehydrogenase